MIMITRRNVGGILCSNKPIILAEIHIINHTNRSRFSSPGYIYTSFLIGKKEEKNMGMFVSLSIRPCRILIIDEILCVLFLLLVFSLCTFNRLINTRYTCVLSQRDVQNTHSEDFSFCYFLYLSVVSFHRTREERRKKILTTKKEIEIRLTTTSRRFS
jgi:hypothetical protein